MIGNKTKGFNLIEVLNDFRKLIKENITP